MLFDRSCPQSAPPVPARKRHVLGAALLLLPLFAPARPAAAAPSRSAEALTALARPVAVPQALREARPLGRLSAAATVKAALTLPWRNPGDLATLIQRQSDPTDPQYKKFLTADQFNQRFAPAQADYDAVIAWAKQSGLNVVQTTEGRNLLVVSGQRDSVEAAFHVQLNRYQLASGRIVYANDTVPRVSRSVATRLSGVVGLTDYAVHQPFFRRQSDLPLVMQPQFTGSGPGGGLTPADIRSLYSINGLSGAGLDGTGETIALYEQDGYNKADIVAYAKMYGLPDPTAADPANGGNPRLQNVLVGTFKGTPVSTTVGEVTLDIEMVLAVAPKARILVYEGNPQSSNNLTGDPNTTTETILDKIAADNIASIVSFSYGLSEDDAQFGGELTAENAIIQRMVAQGQCLYASSGDSGAYNYVTSSSTSGTTTTTTQAYEITVSDPASQPNVVGVGGTTLLTAPNYTGEKTWANGVPTTAVPTAPEGGGGGVSKYWPIPPFQVTAATAASAISGSLVSTVLRNVPDVSLNADPATGYSVYLTSFGATTGKSEVFGGTSASCPLWAAFNALVSQQRTTFGLPRLGFADPDLYAIAAGANYNTDFHDIADGSTNLVFPAVKGFDDATGLGSYVAGNLLADLAPTTFGSGTISVTVIDGSGNPVSGATLTLTTPQISNYVIPASTDGNGVFTFKNLPTGIHNYQGTAQDATVTYTVAVDAAGKTGQSVTGIVPPANVPLTVRNPDHFYPGGTLQMISAPYDYSTVGDFTTLFGTSLGSGTAMPRLFAFSPAIQAYLSNPTAPADTLRLGQGYWALLPTNAYPRRSGVPAPTGQAFRISLLPGWNMIGDPFLKNISVGSIQVDGVNPGTPVGIGGAPAVQLPFYYYDGTKYQSLGTGDSLQQYQGYWIHATQASTLIIPKP